MEKLKSHRSIVPSSSPNPTFISTARLPATSGIKGKSPTTSTAIGHLTTIPSSKWSKYHLSTLRKAIENKQLINTMTRQELILEKETSRKLLSKISHDVLTSEENGADYMTKLTQEECKHEFLTQLVKHYQEQIKNDKLNQNNSKNNSCADDYEELSSQIKKLQKELQALTNRTNASESQTMSKQEIVKAQRRQRVVFSNQFKAFETDMFALQSYYKQLVLERVILQKNYETKTGEFQKIYQQGNKKIQECEKKCQMSILQEGLGIGVDSDGEKEKENQRNIVKATVQDSLTASRIEGKSKMKVTSDHPNPNKNPTPSSPLTNPAFNKNNKHYRSASKRYSGQCSVIQKQKRFNNSSGFSPNLNNRNSTYQDEQQRKLQLITKKKLISKVFNDLGVNSVEQLLQKHQNLQETFQSGIETIQRLAEQISDQNKIVQDLQRRLMRYKQDQYKEQTKGKGVSTKTPTAMFSLTVNNKDSTKTVKLTKKEIKAQIKSFQLKRKHYTQIQQELVELNNVTKRFKQQKNFIKMIEYLGIGERVNGDRNGDDVDGADDADKNENRLVVIDKDKNKNNFENTNTNNLKEMMEQIQKKLFVVAADENMFQGITNVSQPLQLSTSTTKTQQIAKVKRHFHTKSVIMVQQQQEVSFCQQQQKYRNSQHSQHNNLNNSNVHHPRSRPASSNPITQKHIQHPGSQCCPLLNSCTKKPNLSSRYHSPTAKRTKTIASAASNNISTAKVDQKHLLTILKTKNNNGPSSLNIATRKQLIKDGIQAFEQQGLDAPSQYVKGMVVQEKEENNEQLNK